MTARELFEAAFPVPDGVVYYERCDAYLSRSVSDFDLSNDYQAKWIGFQAGAKRKQCVWTYCDDEMAWESECEGMLQIADSPEENEFNFCLYCGGELIEAGKDGAE